MTNGQAGYEVFRAELAHAIRGVPPWDELGDEARRVWNEVAEAIVDNDAGLKFREANGAAK